MDIRRLIVFSESNSSKLSKIIYVSEWSVVSEWSFQVLLFVCVYFVLIVAYLLLC